MCQLMLAMQLTSDDDLPHLDLLSPRGRDGSAAGKVKIRDQVAHVRYHPDALLLKKHTKQAYYGNTKKRMSPHGVLHQGLG